MNKCSNCGLPLNNPSEICSNCGHNNIKKGFKRNTSSFVYKGLNLLKTVFLIFSIILVAASFLGGPSFPASESDTLIHKINIALMMTFFFLIPSIIWKFDSIRTKLPLFKKKKILFSTLGIFIVFIFGGITNAGMNKLYSNDYLTARESYNQTLEIEKAKEVEKVALEKAAQEKAAQEKTELEKAAQENVAQEKAALEKATQENVAQEKAALEKATQEKTALSNSIADLQKKSKNLKAMSDPVMFTNFVNACTDVGIDLSKIKNFEQIDDWLSGPRFEFTYDSTGVLAYINADNTIDSLNVGEVRVFKEGHAPLKIDDYIFPSGLKSDAEMLAKMAISNYLNYPDTADFPLFGWGYGRNEDVLMLSNTVKAKNAFNVQEEFPFYIEIKNNEDTLDVLYVVLDSKIVYGKASELTLEGKEIQIAMAPPTSEIIELSEGSLGQYGKSVTIDNNEYIHYLVPAGNYEVTARTKNAMFFIRKNQLIKNSSGFMESVVVNTIRLADTNTSQKISIKDDEHIFLVINTKISLKPQ